MGITKRFMVDSHLDSMKKGVVNEFFCKNMVVFVSFLWFWVTTYLLYLFRFLSRYLFRYHVNDNFEKGTSECPLVLPQDEKPTVTSSFELKPEPEVIEFEDSEYDGFDEKETPKFSFKFQFQAYDNSRSSNGESVTNTPTETLARSTSKCEVLPSRHFRGFMEEPEVVSFTVKEFFMNSSEDSLDSKEILDDGLLSEKDFEQNSSNEEVIHGDVVNDFCSTVVSEKPESLLGEFMPDEIFYRNLQDEEDFSDEIQFLSEKEFLGFDSDLESVGFGDRFSFVNNNMDSCSEAFLSDGDFDGEVEPKSAMKCDEEHTASMKCPPSSEEVHLDHPKRLDPVGIVASDRNQGSSDSEDIHLENSKTDPGGMDSSDRNQGSLISEKIHLENPKTLDSGGTDTSGDSPIENLLARFEEEIDLMDDMGNSEESHFQESSDLETELQVEREYRKIKAECDREDCSGEQKHGSEETEEPNLHSSTYLTEKIAVENRKIKAECDREDCSGEQKHGSEETEEPNLQSSTYLDSEDSNDLEILWEHQHLIEQLKMELKKVKATGLPTILEESESPRMSEDLKPWKIDEKFLHEDRMGELHKFYKSYKERMRKFDILNYQKMYAIGFLQLKDPLQSISTRKSSTPTLTSVLSQSFRLSKSRRPAEDPTMKFVRELQSDLEVVYVGQVCLSWEFLHWLYGKTRELLESDPYETRQYNQVAGEYQQFQVLIQRFLENEPFQGPRVQNYIKHRCVLRNLLQVPVIKEDPKDKEGVRRRKDAITCSMLLEIIEESMRIFWVFVRADKHEDNVILKGLSRPKVQLHDPADSELLVDVQTKLQKKEKKLKDILRSGNCIVRKFQKHHEEDKSDQLLLFSQVDLKLVSRVLKMSRITTDQLVWCQKKLNKINFAHRKIHVEPSFLLFPC